MESSKTSFNKKEYWRLVLFLTVFYTLWKIIKYLNFLWLYSNDIPSFGEVVNPNEFLDAIFLDWVVVIAFMSVVAYLVQKRFNHRSTRLYFLIPLHLALSFLIGFFIFPVLFMGYWLQNKITFNDGFFNILLDRVIKYMDTNFLTYFSMLGIILLFYYFKGLKDQEAKKSKLESQLMEARLSALSAQLQPHFVFNTLNSVSALIDQDTDKAQKMLTRFGDMLRNILSMSQSVVVDLDRELANLDNYVQILKIRFEEDLNIALKVQNGLEKVKVPNLFLQPIVENAIKHGYGYHKKKLSIQIEIKQQSGFLYIAIKNDGLPLRYKKGNTANGGNGLRILKERFLAQYAENFFFELRNLADKKGVENLIRIPITPKSLNMSDL